MKTQKDIVGVAYAEGVEQGEPMTQWTDFQRSHEEACEQEGHLLHNDGNGADYCLRCPYVAESEPTA